MRNFKKIIPRIAAILIFFFVLESVVKFLYMPYDKYSLYANREYKEEQGKVDMIFCGTSHVYSALNPSIIDERLGVNSFNLGTGSQPLNVTYWLIKEALRINPVKTVFLEASISTMIRGNNDSAKLGVYDRLITPLTRLEFIINEPKNSMKVRELFYSTRVSDYFDLDTVLDNVSYKLSANGQEAPSVMMTPGEPVYYSKGYINNDTVYNGKKAARQNDRTHYWDRDNVSEESLQAFYDIVELCEENDVELILLGVPLTPQFMDNAGDMEDMHAFYQGLASEYGLKYYDMNYIEDRDVLFGNTSFRDRAHLNNTGGTICSNLISEIYQMGDDYLQRFEYPEFEES